MENPLTPLINNLLTQKELKLLQKRFQIIQLLKTDLTYREIARKMGISTTTVVRLNQRLKVRKPEKTKKIKKAKNNFSKKNIKEIRLPWKIG